MERVAVVNEDRIHPWTDFLRARQRAILWMVVHEEIRVILQADPNSHGAGGFGMVMASPGSEIPCADHVLSRPPRARKLGAR
jgi:hypothetical protein